jgi:hypothetical protein
MRKLFFLLTAFLCFKNLVKAQGISANKILCDTSLNYIHDILFNEDNTYYAVGQYSDPNIIWNTNTDAFLAKYSSNNSLLWRKKYGGTAHDQFKTIRRLSNSNLLIIGHTNSTDGDVAYGNDSTYLDIWAVVMDTNGNVLYGTSWGYGNGSYFITNDVAITKEDKILITGSTLATLGDFSNNTSPPFTENPFLIMIDANLSKKWSKVWSSQLVNSVFGPVSIGTNNFIIPVIAHDTINEYVNINPKGDDLDAQFYFIDTTGMIYKKITKGGKQYENGGMGASYENGQILSCAWVAYGTVPDSSCDYYTSELPATNATKEYYSLNSMDTNGVIKWKHLFGAFGNKLNTNINIGNPLILKTNDKIWLAASLNGGDDLWTGPVIGDGDLWVLQFDTLGVLERKLRLGGLCYEYLEFLKGDNNGQVYIGTGTGNCAITQGGIKNDFGCSSDSSKASSVLYKLTTWPTNIKPTQQKQLPIELYPNPANNTIKVAFDNSKKVNVKVVISDLNGKTVNTFNTKKDNLIIEISNYANGQYLLQLFQNQDFSSRLFTVLH